MRYVWVLAAAAAVAAVWLFVRERRKGDFAFRIKKLQKRAANLVSAIMAMEGEGEFLELYTGTPKERLAAQFRKQLADANERAVAVTEGLRALWRRARSLSDFSDLYVDIGIQEEELEKAEAALAEARKLYAALEGPKR